MNNALQSLRILAFFAVLAALAGVAAAQQRDTYDVKANYDKAEYMVPMRDGVKLFTIVYAPKDK